jgi:ribonuclease HI
MEIVEQKEDSYEILITDQQIQTTVLFNYLIKELKFIYEDTLSEFLQKHEFQFRKLLHVKRPETYYKGFKLNFSIREGKDVEAFNNLNRILVLDKRNGKNENYVISKSTKKIHELYVDGSFLSDYNKGGIAVIVKSPAGKYELKTFKSSGCSSCLIELEAAIQGLKLLKDIEEIRLITDSQYVRKGLTEWIINWKLNDWHTANGEKVKNIEHWKLFDALSENKYIEFKYVKAHSQHFENTMADLYARDMATN